MWYKGNADEVYRRYSNKRYRVLNLHSFFSDGHWEMRACNSSLHASVIRYYVVLALAISNAALTRKFCSPNISESDNLRYSCRVWLINLGLNGEEVEAMIYIRINPLKNIQREKKDGITVKCDGFQIEIFSDSSGEILLESFTVAARFEILKNYISGAE